MPTNTPKHIMKASQTALRRVMCMAMLIVSLVVNVGSLVADTAQYYYDELDRLVGVVNEQGDAAVYNWPQNENDRGWPSAGDISI